MKVWKLVSGILSCILFVLVAFQSCAAGISNALESNGEVSGSAGILVLAAAIGAVIPAILIGLAEGLIEFARVISKGAPVIAKAVVDVFTNIILLINQVGTRCHKAN